VSGARIRKLVMGWLGGVDGKVEKVSASGARMFSDKLVVATRVDTDRKVFLVDDRDEKLCGIIRETAVGDGWSVSLDRNPQQ
jgi:hypothetical protein